MKFSDLGLSPSVLQAVAEAGYLEPTPIQEQAIPRILAGRDIVGTAQTGTGKTAGFTLPMLDVLAAGRARARMPRSLILEPTRELATQVAETFNVYGKYHSLTKALLIGGVSFADQDHALQRGVDVLIATPGRLLDHVGRGKVLLADIRILVIDEADRMLDMGFVPDIERIIKQLPLRRQTLMFSATMPREIRRLAGTYLSNPAEVAVAAPDSSADTVTQLLVAVPGEFKAKREVLRRLLRSHDVQSAIIFCNRKRDVGVLHRSLARHGFDAAALHGDLPQSARTETLERFRKGKIRLLVASDVAARGLDILAMSHVFNFDVPLSAEDYVHRIGRTGRAGLEGCAITLAAPIDRKRVAAIEALIGKKIRPADVNGGKQKAASPATIAPTPAPLTPNPTPPAPASATLAPAPTPPASAPLASTSAPTPTPRPPAPNADRSTRHARNRPQKKAEAPPQNGDASKTQRQPPPRGNERVVGMGDHIPAFLLR